MKRTLLTVAAALTLAVREPPPDSDAGAAWARRWYDRGDLAAIRRALEAEKLAELDHRTYTGQRRARSAPLVATGARPRCASTRKRHDVNHMRTAALAAFAAAAAMVATAMPANAAVVDSDPPMGLMIQVSTLAPNTTPAKLKEWMVAVRKNHRDPRKPGYVNNLVLQDIADVNGTLLTPYLDAIAPFLPGGATPAFTKVSIGGAEDQIWTGVGSKYIQGIQDPAFRERNVSLSVSTGKAFKARYPNVRFDWYIPYEANVAAFWDYRIEQGYLAYINGMITRLSAVKSGSFSWSPSFWSAQSQMPAWAMTNLDQNLTQFFPNLRAPLTVNLQDFVGQSGGATGRRDAVVWVRYLNRWTGRTQMNVEQFGLNATGSLIPGDPVEVPARSKFYISQGVQLGPSFDIRYWHVRLYGGATS